MEISDEFRREVLSRWYDKDFRRYFLYVFVNTEFSKQYPRSEDLPNRPGFILDADERVRMWGEVEKAVWGNKKPHIILEALRRIEPRPEWILSKQTMSAEKIPG